jgi:threonine dehydrogenase-like Zn-dependent dehydrogenase
VTAPGVLPMVVTVMAHLRPDTVIRSRVHAAEERVTVRLENEGIGGSDVTLFADRAELVRLHEALGALVAELDEQRAALARAVRAGESAA